MPIAHSKLTAQGQISVPAEIRRKLGIGPGSLLEWHEDGEQVIVRRAGRYSSQEVHQALFPAPPPAAEPLDRKAAIRKYMKRKHTRK
ncbi:MAG TPA: AbrB/MazE/SpoVT family DNA-binding domain-containing protein [Povalibacter sp.]|nr:AbrB/MazE/SpoVT family DNA-binding domain-containing protein [Povalibacter sp.]